jgi:peptidoglycan/xylan/chitin deacetylase (PgdA/CDA1 family)
MIVALGGLAAATAHADQRRAPRLRKTAVLVPAKPAAKAAIDAQLLALTNDPLLGKADRVSGEEVQGLVAFTFDDGPNPETTPFVIDALEKYDIPATFFIVTRHLTGKLAEEGRAVLKRELAAGFLVGSHTVSHRKLRGALPQKLAAEIDESIRVLAKEAERPIGLFRAPFGALDGPGRGWLKKRGLTETFWSIDPRDWEAHDAERLRKKIFHAIIHQNGGVVLMHDVKPITAEITALVLDDLEAENCKRLEEGRAPIWPVSIHYFLRDAKKLRAIPDDVKQATAAYQAKLPERCAARPAPIPEGFEIFFLG